jgi:hypothetical protein
MRAVSALELRILLSRRQLTSPHGSGRASRFESIHFLDDQPRDVCGVKIEDLQQKIGQRPAPADASAAEPFRPVRVLDHRVLCGGRVGKRRVRAIGPLI